MWHEGRIVWSSGSKRVSSVLYRYLDWEQVAWVPGSLGMCPVVASDNLPWGDVMDGGIGPWPVLPRSAACSTGRKGERGGSPRRTLKVRRIGRWRCASPSQAGPPVLKATAFRPISGLAFILCSVRSYQAGRVSSFRPYGTFCREPQRASALTGGVGEEGYGTLYVPPLSVSRSQGEARLPGRILSYSRPRLASTPQASSLSSALLDAVRESPSPR
ncbi:hypothetical protein NDU88_010876 [Pleurodeles waltl]|uniref:Uncharacterized protein n=1 Tax=Pleurodeles waltl TaxID=8319 RepID=A0AAV7Q378_PLEWA|nr:hypothetical protein NDU88_010876 [Pleurodeles waltl]